MPPVRRALLAAVLLPAAAAAEPLRNGFDLTDAAVPADEILHGGPPKDGIPAIDAPVFEDVAAAAAWLGDEDQVIGLDRGGIQRAYPLRILNWHEVVNDAYGEEAVVVTYCPLCGTGIVFAPPPPAASGFGVSGLLYNSDVLLYDRATESLWSQILGRAVTGPRRGEELPAVPSLQTSWGHWRALHPATEVLSRETGFVRNYSSNPYAGYADSPSVFFPLRHRPPAAAELHLKERVLGLRHGGGAKAYPFSRLAAYGQSRIADEVGGAPVFIHWDAAAGAAWASDAAGQPLAAVEGYWFAWYAFYPATEVFTAPAPQ